MGNRLHDWQAAKQKAIIERENKQREVKLEQFERLNALDKAFKTQFKEVDNKLTQLPIIFEALQHHANSIAEKNEQDKRLKDEIHKLSNRLDSYDLLIKLVCSSLDPDNLQGQAKKLHGLLCLTDEHDNL